MYGLIGKKIGHSFSAKFFNKKFADEGIDESYNLFPLEEIEELHDLLSSQTDLKGLNVTIPYKQEVIPFMDSLSEEAKEIGAINVIKIQREGDKISLKGYNTDSIGFRDSLIPLLRPDIKHALVLGTGGASKAVGYILSKLGIVPTFVSRKKSASAISYEDLDEKVLNSNLLIVNATPLGMFPDVNSCAPIPYHLLTKNHVCYDLVYNPQETEFLKRAAKQGAVTKNGIEMLHGQALAAWDIWSGNNL